VPSLSDCDLSTNTAQPGGFGSYRLLLEDPEVMASLGNTLFHAARAPHGRSTTFM